MHQTVFIQSQLGAWVILACVIFVIAVICGHALYHRFKVLNRRHHYVVFNDDSIDAIYGYNDDED